MLADGKFPSTSVAKPADTQATQAATHDILTLLKAILQLMPLHKSVESPVSSKL